MELLAIHRAGDCAEEHLGYEDALFQRLRQVPHPVVLYYICSSCIVVGRNNSIAEWVDRSVADADGVPILRRLSGGGTVFLDQHVLNYSFLMPRKLLDALTSGDNRPATSRYIDYFRQLIIHALSNASGCFASSGVSDVSLNGRKVSGNAQRIAPTLVQHHGTLMLRRPLAAIERYLPLPPDRPAVAHRDFITGMSEEGVHASPAQLKAWLSAEYAHVLNAT